MTYDERFNDVRDRTGRFLRDGVRVVWVVYLPWNDIGIYWRSHQISLSVKDNLTGGDIIPGFSIPVAIIFRDKLLQDEELRQKVVQQIEESFADTPYPGDNNIWMGLR
jgi:hypothetical protein